MKAEGAAAGSGTLQAGSSPRRRPARGAPRAPRPRGHLARPHSPLRQRFLDALWRWNRALRPRPVGQWATRRLDRARSFATQDLLLGRGGPGLAGLRVAFLSDLHTGGFLDGGDVDRICVRLAACEPDLVCLGGDLIEGGDAAELELLDAGLARLRPPLGVFAVPGNHEYFADLGPEVLARAFSERGVTSLVNSGRRIERDGASLWLAGVDDLSRGAPDLSAALAGAREDEPVLLLSHHPDLFVEAAWAGVDVTLSGHTHAGQIVVLGWTAFKRSHYGYQGGWFEREGARLYVGRGAGVTGMPVRLGAPPEVPIFRLVPPSV